MTPEHETVSDPSGPGRHARSASRRFVYRRSREVPHPPERAFRPLLHLGNERGWYFADWLWRLRANLDRALGGPGPARRPIGVELREGGAVDLWEVERLRPQRTLLLRARMKVPGDAWLRFDVEPRRHGSLLTVQAIFDARPLSGRLYWLSSYPVHAFIFGGLLRRLAYEAGRPDRAAPAMTRTGPPLRPRQEQKPSPCMAGCPNGTNIRSWITTIAQREKLGLSDAEAYTSAWRTITDVNPFPAVTGRICPHPCEAGCNRKDKDGAVSVKQLERFVGDWAIERGLGLARLETETKPETIGVIGSGPAGLSFAYQMARRGYPVTIYERQSIAGGMLRHGIPVYRLPHEVLDAEVQRILDLGIELRPNTTIGADLRLDDLRARHAAVFLGIGAAAGAKLDSPGEEGPGVLSATDYLERVHLGDPPPVGSEVVVVGGGDVAFDAARVARRGGARVTIVYRRSRTEMPADDREVEEASSEGVTVEYLAAPVEILRRDGAPVGIVVRGMELGRPDESGRRVAVPIPGSDRRMPASAVIVAVSRNPDWGGLEIPVDDRGRPRTEGAGRIDDALWTGGDILDPGIAGTAIAHGRGAAEALHARLRGLPLPESPTLRPVTVGSVRPADYAESARNRPGRLPGEQWLAHPEAEIHLGLSEEQALQEAGRCLSCGSCFGCERCWMYCAHGCFSRLDEVRPGAYFALTPDACRACGKCVDLCPCGYLDGGEAG